MNCPKCNTPLVNGECPNCSKDNNDVEIFDELDMLDKNSDVFEEVKADEIDKSEVTNNSQKKKFSIKVNKNAKMPTLLSIIFIIVFFVIGLLFGKMFFSKTVVTNPKLVVNKNALTVDGKKNTTNIGGVTYSIPEKYIYDKTLSGVLVYDKDDSFRIYMRYDEGSYKILTSSMTSIKETLKTTDLNVLNIKEVKVGDNKALAIETSSKLENRLMAYFDASNDHVFYIEIVTSDNSFNYDILSFAAEILKEAKVEGSKSKMEKIEVKDISKLAITAANTYNSLKN